MGLTPGFWRDRRVLVTGHTGFKGAWLCLWLRKLGADVWGYSLPPEQYPNLFEVIKLADGMQSRFGDVRDCSAVAQIVHESRPSVVFHLAAQSLVRRSYSQPLETLQTNVIGTANLLDACRHAKDLDAVVVVTSDKCYANDDSGVPLNESHPLGGSDLYSASKACAEHVAAAYRHSFFVEPSAAIATARAGNVIGGGDWSQDRIVPDIVRALSSGSALRLRYPHATRPWQHVLEPLFGYAVLAESLASDRSYADAWNFGPAQASGITVLQLVEKCFEIWGADTGQVSTEGGEHAPEHGHLQLDSAKSSRRLGVQSRLTVDEACDWALQWYRQWHDGKDPRELCLQQIQLYENRI